MVTHRDCHVSKALVLTKSSQPCFLLLIYRNMIRTCVLYVSKLYVTIVTYNKY